MADELSQPKARSYSIILYMCVSYALDLYVVVGDGGAVDVAVEDLLPRLGPHSQTVFPLGRRLPPQ